MARRRRLTPRVRWALSIGIGFVVVWAVGVTVLMVLARQSVNRGVDELERASEELSPAALLRGEGREALREAEREFERANDLISSPFVAPLRIGPVVGRQVRSIDAMTRGARDVVKTGQRAMTDAEAKLRDTPEQGNARVALIEELEVIAARAERRVRTVDLGPDSHLIGPIADARIEFADKLAEVQQALGDARAVARGTAQFLEGPGRYLVLAANNGEMRAGSGMLLQAGILTVDGGTFELGPMEPTGDLGLPPGAVEVSGDLADRWGFLEPGQEWRNLAATPRFDATAELAAAMWKARTGEDVDGVLALDPVALRAFLAAEGPIAVDGREFSADDVVGYSLLGQYQEFPLDDPDQQARRDQLSSIARATVEALDSRPWEPADLVDELRAAGDGRHVLAWSRDPIEQEAWKAAGVSGELDDDSVLLSVLNLGGNKLDQFLTVDATIRVEPARAGHAVSIEIHLENNAPDAAPPYVTGPYPGTDFAPGEYFGYLSVNVPGSAEHVDVEGASQLVAAGADGPTRVVAAPVRVVRGGAVDLTVRFELPEAVASFEVEPSARVPPVDWTFRGDEWTDEVARRVAWG